MGPSRSNERSIRLHQNPAAATLPSVYYVKTIGIAARNLLTPASKSPLTAVPLPARRIFIDELSVVRPKNFIRRIDQVTDNV
jgi:hypothetical protein